MLLRRLSLVLTTLVFLMAARQRAVQHPAAWPLPAAPADRFSASKPADVTTRHLALDLAVDFEQRELRGTATLDIENLSGTRALVLDTNGLQISRVTLDGGTPTLWSLGEETDNGEALTIGIEPATHSVTIEYSTSPGAAGLYWNTAEQSFGRKQPYLYTLSEPTDARSWFPSQDTPSVRMTYDATLHVPPGMLALMSAQNNPRVVNDTGVYTFHMPYTVPSYLVALAAGRLEFHPFDSRTGVYAEPELMPDAVRELSYLPSMLAAAERIAGPFPFARHDVLLGPPTFVAGGMEHPMLNIVDPFSAVTGNRSRPVEPNGVIAHELAHSWSGDATTLATWDDVWLNEGMTSYLTMRIMEEMLGGERAQLEWFNDRRSYSIFVQNAEDPDNTILHRAVPYPFAGFGSTGYIKGELFMKTLEDSVGRPSFDFFLRRYFELFAFRWVDHQSFLAAFRYAALAGDVAREQSLLLNEWLYSPGLPSNLTAPTASAIFDRVRQRADAFAAGSSLAQLGASSWLRLEIDLFLQLANANAVRARMAEIDAQFSLSSLETPPSVWLARTIQARYEPGMPAVERVMMHGGPNNTMVQLYNTMAGIDRLRAIEIFNRARKRYDPRVEAQIAEILGLTNTAKIAA